MFFYVQAHFMCAFIYMLTKASCFIVIHFKKSSLNVDEIKINPLYDYNNRVLKRWDKFRTRALKEDTPWLHKLFAKYWWKHALIKQNLEHVMEEVQNDN